MIFNVIIFFISVASLLSSCSNRVNSDYNPLSKKLELYEKAKLYQNKGKLKKAFSLYKKVVDEYPNIKNFNKILSNKYLIADTLYKSGTQGIFGTKIGSQVQYSELIKMYSHIIKIAPYSKYSANCRYNIANIYYKDKDFEEALNKFNDVINHHSGTKLAVDSKYMIFKILGMKSKKPKRLFYDERHLSAGKEFIDQYPKDHRVSEVKKEINDIENRKIENIYNIALFHEKKGGIKSAKFYYNEVLKKGDSHWSKKAKLKLKSPLYNKY